MWVLISLILLFGIVYILIQQPKVQTYLVHKVSDYLSNTLQTKVNVKSVNIQFFTTAVIEEILIEDKKKDTILYAGNIKARFGVFELFNQNFEIKNLTLENARIRLFRGQNDSDFNYQFIADAFASNDTSTSKTKNPFLKIGTINLKNISFTFRDEPAVDVTVHVSELNIAFNKLSLDEPILNLSKIIIENPLVEVTSLFDSLPKMTSIEEPDTSIIHLNKKSFVLLVDKFQMNNGHFIYIKENREADSLRFDLNHMDFTNINFDVENGKFLLDTISGFIKNLTAHEKSGLDIKRLTANARVTPNESVLDNLILQLPRSEIQDRIVFQYLNFTAFYDFISSVNMRADFKKSYLTLSDLSCFAPELKNMVDPTEVNGKLAGTVDNLKIKELYLKSAKQTIVKGKGTIQGLPSIDGMFFDMQFDEVISSANDLKIIYPEISLPKEVVRAGTISLKGNATGFLNDFVGNILINTDEGMIQTDLNMKLNQGIPKYSGSISTSNFDLGKIFNIQGSIGKASFSTTIAGSGIMLTDVNTTLVSHIEKFEALDYEYKNITVNGILDSKIFNGKLVINDENIQLDFQGKVDLQDSIPEYDFFAKVINAKLDKLGFISRPLIFSSNLSINLKGQNPLTGSGLITADQTIISDETDSYKLKALSFSVEELNDQEKKLELRSDIISIDINGQFNLPELPDAIIASFKNYLPSLPTTVIDSPSIQKFDFAIKLKEMKDFNNFFLKGTEGFSNTSINGFFNNEISEISFNGIIPFVKYGKTFSNDMVLIGETNQGMLSLSLTSNFLQVNDSLKILDPFISATLENDKVLFNIKANDISGKYKIDLLAKAYGKGEKIHLNFLPSLLLLNGQDWSFNNSNEILIGNKYLQFFNTDLIHNNQSIRIQNIASADTSDIKLSFNNLQIEDFYNLFMFNNYQVKGRVTGYANIMNIFDAPRYSANLTTLQFGLNGDSADKVIAIVDYDPAIDQMNISVNVKDDLYDIESKGIYLPGNKKDSINFKIEIVKCELPILGKYLGDYISNVEGKVAGQVFIAGSTDRPILSGSLVIPSATTKINYLGTSYSFSGETVKLYENRIDLGEFTIYDDKGNSAVAGGEITHKYLSDFNLKLHLTTKNFHLLNTTQFDNTAFYGNAFAGGTLLINGNIDALDLSATLTSNQGTEISIPVSDEASVSGNSFVRFVNRNDSIKLIKNIANETAANLKLNFDLSLNPLAKVNIIFDQKAGDIISGTGNGNVRLEIDLDGNFNMFGNYIIEKGDYNFTLQNFFNKKFAIDKGSSVSWNGDPYLAQIDIKAIYSLSRVSFSDLVSQDLSQLSESDKKDIEKKVPIDVSMQLTGSLLTPNIAFDIRQPKSESSSNSFASRKLGEIRADENELNKQVFGLLMINRFLPPDANTGGLVSSGVTTSVSEFLFNQLSYWASQNKFNIGVGLNYTGGSSTALPNSNGNIVDPNLQRRELQLVLTKSFFHDRVSIDIGGNLDVNNTTQTNKANAYLSDFTVEYKITPDGRFAARAFSRSQYDIIEERNRDTYGVSLSFRKDFNKFGDLFRSERDKKKIRLNKKK